MFGDTLSVVAYKKSKTSDTGLANEIARAKAAEEALGDRITDNEIVVSNISTDTTYGSGNYYVSCDASTLGFTVTLPNATIATGYAYTITKTDTTTNVVTIASVSLIAGEVTQDLRLEQESLTFFSNGISWIVR